MPEESQPQKQKSTDARLVGVFPEFLFVLLPLVVILIVRLSQGQIGTILSWPEISFASAVLFGQTIVKIVSGTAAVDEACNWQNVAAVVSAFIVLGLVPSLTILGLILIRTTPSTGLGIAQIILLILSSMSTFSFGAVGQDLISRFGQRH